MQRDVYKVHIDSKLQDSVRTILKRNVRNVPVVDDHDTLIGLITRANLVDIVYDSIWGEENETSHSSKTYSNEVERENERQNETQQRLTTQGTQRYHEDIMNGTDREHTHNTDDTGGSLMRDFCTIRRRTRIENDRTFLYFYYFVTYCYCRSCTTWYFIIKNKTYGECCIDYCRCTSNGTNTCHFSAYDSNFWCR